MLGEGTFSAAVFIRFLRRLLRRARRKVFLIVEEDPVQVAAVALGVTRQRLINTDAVAWQRPRRKDELMGNARRNLWSAQRRPKKVRRCFRHRSVRCAS